MNEITKCLNHLCEFIRKKRVIIVNGQSRDVSFMDLTGNVFGAFKGNPKHKDTYASISTFMENSQNFLNKKVELENITLVLFELFTKSRENEINDDSYMILNDLINNVKIGGHAIIDVEHINKLKDIKERLLAQFNPETIENIDDVIPETQNLPDTAGLLSNALNRLVANDININQNSTPINSTTVQSVNQQQQQQQLTTSGDQSINVKDLFDQLRLIAREEINKTNSVGSNTNLPQKLTSQSLKELRQNIYRKFEKRLKIENIINIFKTHKDNNTVPNAIFFKRFPKPLWADDPIFVDTHNNIIKLAQSQIIDSIIEHGNVMIDCINVELTQLRCNLDNCYNGNKDKFFDNILSSVQTSLKSFLDSSNAKLLRVQNNYFEDHITTEYEPLENLKDDYITNYLLFKNDAEDNINNINNKNNEQTKQVQHSTNNKSSFNKESTNDDKKPYYKNRKYYKQNNNANNIDNNWRTNMVSQNQYNNQNASSSKQTFAYNNSKHKNFQKVNNQNFQQVQNQKPSG